jgi:hypothetical protein
MFLGHQHMFLSFWPRNISLFPVVICPWSSRWEREIVWIRLKFSSFEVGGPPSSTRNGGTIFDMMYGVP